MDGQFYVVEGRYLTSDDWRDRFSPLAVTPSELAAQAALAHLEAEFDDGEFCIRQADQNGQKVAISLIMAALSRNDEFSAAYRRAVGLCLAAVKEFYPMKSAGSKASAPTKLTDDQQAALDLIRAEGPIPAKRIASRLSIEESTLRRHVLPALKPLGVQNNRDGNGYFLPPT